MSVYRHLLQAVDDGRACCLIVLFSERGDLIERLCFEEGRLEGGALDPSLAAWLAEKAAGVLEKGACETLRIPEELRRGEFEAYLEPHLPPTPLVLVGGGHVGKALHDLVQHLDFNVTVVDDRPIYVSPERFPGARGVCCRFEEVFRQVPVRPETFIVIMTRGHRADGLVLEQALRTPARYIGVIGSQRKLLSTYRDLRERGVALEQLQRVHGPIGLEIGAQGAREIAVSVLAELIAVRNGLEGAEIRSKRASLPLGSLRARTET